MTVTEQSRHELLERYGRWYGEERFAIAFTGTVEGEAAKKVVTDGWDKTPALNDAEYAAGLVANRGITRNPAIVLRPSNLVVLECDTEQDLLAIEALELPATITVRSSKPYKRHFYFRPPHELGVLPYVAFRFESGKLTADAGRYFLAPPSIHPSGAIYAFIPDRGPDDVDLAELPEHIYHDLAAQSQESDQETRHQLLVDPTAKVQPGKRRDSIFRFASAMRRWTASRPVIVEAAQAWNLSHCEPVLTLEQVEMQVDGAMKMPGGQDLARILDEPPPPQYDDPGPEWEQPPRPVYLVDPPPSDGDDTWTAIDLANPQYAVPAQPPVINGLLYLAKRHVISGPPESAKTLVAYQLLLEAHRAGHKVAIIDFEMGPTAARRLLDDLGATLEEIRAIHYVEPDVQPRDGLKHLVDLNPGFVLLDAAVGAYDASGLDDNARKDAERFARIWIRPLFQARIATLVIDHVTKNVDTRGKYTIGSERKVGQADIHISLEALKALSRGHSGLVKVHVHKDRPGFLERPHAAMIELHSHPDTHQITWQIRAATETDETGEFRPTGLMEKVSRYLEKQTKPVSRNTLETEVKGKRDYLRNAIEILHREGHIDVTEGARKALMLTLKDPYRKPENDFAPTSPHFAPGEDTTTSPHLAPPYKGDERAGRGQSGEEPRSTSPQSWADDPELQKLLDDPDFPQ